MKISKGRLQPLVDFRLGRRMVTVAFSIAILGPICVVGSPNLAFAQKGMGRPNEAQRVQKNVSPVNTTNPKGLSELPSGQKGWQQKRDNLKRFDAQTQQNLQKQTDRQNKLQRTLSDEQKSLSRTQKSIIDNKK